MNKSEIEKAIEFLHIGLTMPIEDSYLLKQPYITARCALLNELDRMQGCKHCTGVLIGIYEVSENCCLTVCDIGANYCPNCGRQIKQNDTKAEMVEQLLEQGPNGKVLNKHGEYLIRFAKNHGISISAAAEHPTVKAHYDYCSKTNLLNEVT